MAVLSSLFFIFIIFCCVPLLFYCVCVCICSIAFSPGISCASFPFSVSSSICFFFFFFVLFSILTMEQFSNQFVKIKIAHKWFKHTMGDSVHSVFFSLSSFASVGHELNTRTHFNMYEHCFQYSVGAKYGVYASVCVHEKSGKSVWNE